MLQADMHTHQDQQSHLLPPGGFGEGHRHLGLQAALGGVPRDLGYVPTHLHSEVVPEGDVGHALGGLQHQVVASVHAVSLALVALRLRWTNQSLQMITTPERNERKGRTTPFGVNLLRSQALYWAAQIPFLTLCCKL